MEQRFAAFERKPDFSLKPVTVEKTIHLPAKAYEQFLSKPLEEYVFLRENVDQMWVDQQGTFHCLLVTGEDHIGGVLVQSEGAGFACYASYVPEAAAMQYVSLSAFAAQLAGVVDYIIQDGTHETTEGNWRIGFDQLNRETGFYVEGKPILQKLIAQMLSERQEVADVQIEGDSFDVCYYLDFCVNCRKETERSEAEKSWPSENHQTRLLDLLTTHWENVHLLYEDMDAVPHTIVELDSNTLTAKGKEAWADVLGAQVVRVYDGFYGLQVELAGVRGSRIEAFSAMLGGYCSVEEYEAWVNEEEDQNDFAMTET